MFSALVTASQDITINTGIESTELTNGESRWIRFDSKRQYDSMVELGYFTGASFESDAADEVDTLAAHGVLTNYIDVTNDNGSGGAVGDGSTDCTTAINEAITAAQALDADYVTLYFPPCETSYIVTDTITVPRYVNVVMEGPMEYSGSTNEACLVIGQAAQEIHRHNYKLWVTRETQSDWTNDNCIGIRLINVQTCDINIIEASKFTVGVELNGDGKGCAYNKVDLGRLVYNKYALILDATDSGWVNENVFFNGRFDSGNINPTVDRYGVMIISSDNTRDGNDNNVFYKPSFEIKKPGAGDDYAITITDGYYNSFHDVRHEGGSTCVAWVSQLSKRNRIDLGYGGWFIDSILTDTSEEQSTVVTSTRWAMVEQEKKLVYNSGLLYKKANYYNTTPNWYLPDCHFANDGNADRKAWGAGTNYVLDTDDGYFRANTGYGFGGIVDTRQVHRFIFVRDVVFGNEGMLVIRCYDSEGSVLDGSGSTVYCTHGTWSTDYGGAYKGPQDATAAYPVFFRLHDDVKSIAVILAGDDVASGRVMSFQLYSVGSKSTTWEAGFTDEVYPPVPGANMGTAAPTAGTWERGMIIWDASPSASGDIGWVCTVGGTPGTWKAFGAIEA